MAYETGLPQNVPLGRAPFGVESPLAVDPYGVQMVNTVHGRYGEQTLFANHYVAHLATAAAIPISTSLTFVVALWNPSGTGKVLIPTRLNLGYVTGTEVPGNIVISQLTSAGNSVATGLPFATFVDIVPTNARIGSPNLPVGRAAASGTITAAATIKFTTGLNHLTTTAASTTLPPYELKYDFDGSLAIDPGNAIFVMANAATVTTFLQSIFWYEQNV